MAEAWIGIVRFDKLNVRAFLCASKIAPQPELVEGAQQWCSTR
jgi:hypothetical protein